MDMMDIFFKIQSFQLLVPPCVPATVAGFSLLPEAAERALVCVHILKIH